MSRRILLPGASYMLMTRNVFAALLIACTLLAACAPAATATMPPDRAVFIEHLIQASGECMEGSCAPGPTLEEGRGYRFNPGTGVLETFVPLPVNPGLQIVLADGGTLSGFAGTGSSATLYAVSSLPHEQNALTIQSLTTGGTVQLVYNGDTLTLAPGYDWRDTTINEVKTETGKVRLTITDRIVNHGILDTTKISVRAAQATRPAQEATLLPPPEATVRLPEPTAPPPEPTAPSPTGLTNLASQILADPGRFAGQQVILVGYYRGWNLLGEASGAPPVTRSDWVIKDEGGAIYVEANGTQADGHARLDPWSQAETAKIVRLTGVVRVSAGGQAYIAPSRIELLP